MWPVRSSGLQLELVGRDFIWSSRSLTLSWPFQISTFPCRPKALQYVSHPKWWLFSKSWPVWYFACKCLLDVKCEWRRKHTIPARCSAFYRSVLELNMWPYPNSSAHWPSSPNRFFFISVRLLHYQCRPAIQNKPSFADMFANPIKNISKLKISITHSDNPLRQNHNPSPLKEQTLWHKLK